MNCVQVVDILHPLIAVALSRIHLAKNNHLLGTDRFMCPVDTLIFI
jgi:hypothetical protein